jgi:ABC-2 type transport system permease protein
MLSRLIRFELSYHLKQMVFWAATFCISWMAVLITSQRGSMLLYANSSYAITQTMLFISPNIIFVLCVLASGTLLRDSQTKMEPLIFTTPLDKFQYLMSRFLGLNLAAMLSLGIAVVSMMLTLLFMDDSILGPFHLSYYLQSYSIFLLPAIILCSSVVFATAMLSKNMLAVYVSGIVLFVIYLIGSVFGNSPLLATSNSLLSDNNGFATLLEPYGLLAFMEQSGFWTSEQRNTLTPVLSGSLLLNRVLWLAISFSLFAYAYKKFSFRAENKISKQSVEAIAHNPRKQTITPYKTTPILTHFNKVNFSVWVSKLKLEYLTATKGKTFIVLLLTTFVFTLGNLAGNIFDGPIGNGQPFYPSTEMLIELLRQPLTDIGMLVAVFFTVELYWNERAVKIDPLIDATPTQNATFYLAKISTVLMICFTLILSSILVAVLFQFSQGVFDITLWNYLILFYYAGVPILLTTLLVMGLQRLAKNKPMGLVLGISIFVVGIFIKNLGFVHPLITLAYRSQFIFSDMADTIYHDDAAHWYNLYWLSIGMIVALFTVKFWQRGASNIRQKFNTFSRNLMALCVSLFVASGSYIFYQTNVFNHYATEAQRLQMMEDYEREYAQYLTIPQPTVVDINVDVDIYPESRKYQAKGRYIFENQTAEPLTQIMVSVLNQSHIQQQVKIKQATLERYDARYQSYLYSLNSPMQPGEKRELSFTLMVVHNAFSALDGEHYVTKGGAYIELEDIMPQFGYMHSYVMEDEQERQKRGLPSVKLALPALATSTSSDDWVKFETTVSTSKPHTVVTVGKLQKTWSQNERNYFHYKSDHKVKRQLAYTSAEFSIDKQSHKGVDISIYHSPEHDKDNQYVFDALLHTMDYFAENYAPYHSDQFTVVELPYFSSIQSFGSAQPGMYLGVENRFFNLDNRNLEGSDFNPLLRGVSHEFAHQYWGGYVEPNYIGGYSLLTEVLCKYTELVMSRKLYGEYSTNIEVNLSIERYLRARPYSSNIEKPLFSVGMEPHIYYAKGKQSMHALIDLLGEASINKALRNLLANYGYPKKPTSLDLLNEFYKVAETDNIKIIDDLFKRVVFHDFIIHSAKTEALTQGGYRTTVDVSTLKRVLNRQSNKEQAERIDDNLEMALYSGFPTLGNSNMLTVKKIKFNQDRSTVTLFSDEKPSHVQIDPNRFRIDRSMADNVMQID